MQKRLTELVSKLGCAAINVEVDSQLGVRLTGSIDSQENQAEFLKRAKEVQGVGRVDASIAVRPWPLCELDGIESWKTSPEFSVRPNKVDQPYKIDKDPVTFQVVPPSGRQGFLNMVFLQSDKTVFLYEPWSQVPVQLGDRTLRDTNFGEGLDITFGPPAGKMAIIAVFSFEPLALVTFEKEGPNKGQSYQRSKEYFANLKQVLERHPGSIASYIVFDTVQDKAQ